jgi:serine/threonine protein phosphatase 1
MRRGNLTTALRASLSALTRRAGAVGKRMFAPPAEDLPLPEAAPPAVNRVTEAPEGICLYAVGDIHGRMDLLSRLMQMIEADAATMPRGTKPQIVFLGDYIDRGLQSRDVIEFFASGGADRFDPVFLLGNHEEALLRFLNDVGFGKQWARFGGAETLYSYGLAPPNTRVSLHSHEEMAAATKAWERVWHEFRTRLPAHHLSFLEGLKPLYMAGDYLFVHAGLRPGIALEQQSARDMLWIREEFLEDRAPFAQLIVHGHTPGESVYRDDRRIGLDTGAFLSGRLSAARLFGTDVAFLST